MFEDLYNQLPIISKPYLIIIIILLIGMDVTIYKFYKEYKKQHNQKPKEEPQFILKEKK